MLLDRCPVRLSVRLSVCLSVCQSVCLSVMLVYCDQTVGWMKMKLGTEVGLGPGHIMLDGYLARPTQRGTLLPNFWPMSVVAKWLDRPRCHLVRIQALAQATLC